MNETGYVALVDTTRAELRERIERAWNRFDGIVQVADPSARAPGFDWTVQQVVAHVLAVTHRYLAVARGNDFRRATHPRDLDAINQREMEAALAPMAELGDQLHAAVAEMDDFFEVTTDKPPVFAFHAGVLVDGITAQTNWLGELLFHGHDIARAIKAPWEFPERDMLLIARGLMQIGSGSGYLRADVSPDANVSVAANLPEARPYVIHIHDGTAEMRARRPDDRPDAVLRMPASTLAKLLYQRIGPLGAARHGLRIVGGRRPWGALGLQSYFERP
ncbi:MAG: DinB family protein [Mycobacterium sp.]